MTTIYLAGGCFWGVERFISQIAGVLSTEVGYINGSSDTTTYEAVCNGSGHAECVKVSFDESKLDLLRLLDFFYQVIDPTSINKQGNDAGIQYRTGIYYEDESLHHAIKSSLENLQREYQKPIAIELGSVSNYFRAEEYHQNYLVKNPNGYCHISPSRMRQILKLQD